MKWPNIAIQYCAHIASGGGEGCQTNMYVFLRSLGFLLADGEKKVENKNKTECPIAHMLAFNLSLQRAFFQLQDWGFQKKLEIDLAKDRVGGSPRRHSTGHNQSVCLLFSCEAG